MKTVVYCFTGTGNCLEIALALSEKIDNSSVLKLSDDTAIDLSADAIGFVFPVYFFGVPDNVKHFLLRLPRDMSSKYLFAAATCKSQPGDVIGQAARLLKQTENRLSAGFTIFMPGNNIAYYNTETEAVQREKIESSRRIAEEIADTVVKRGEHLPNSGIKNRIISAGLHKTMSLLFGLSDKKFRVTENCAHCGVCKNVCPAQNIEIVNGSPVWMHNCLQCTACINACPNKAIQYGKSTLGRGRYINSGIGIKGLIEQNRK